MYIIPEHVWSVVDTEGSSWVAWNSVVLNGWSVRACPETSKVFGDILVLENVHGGGASVWDSGGAGVAIGNLWITGLANAHIFVKTRAQVDIEADALSCP